MELIKPVTTDFIQISCSKNEFEVLTKKIEEHANENKFSYNSGLNDTQMLELVADISTATSKNDRLIFNVNRDKLYRLTCLIDEITHDQGGCQNPRLTGVFKELERAKHSREPLKTLIQIDQDISRIHGEVAAVLNLPWHGSK